jgi:hypothetical protein
MKKEIERAPTDSEGYEGDVIKMPSRKSIDVVNVTRFELVNISSDSKCRYIAENISISDVRLQDDGETLKIFLT